MDVIDLSSDSEGTVPAGAAARHRAAREALAAHRAAKKQAAAAAKKLAFERAAAAKKLPKQRVAAREASAVAIRGPRMTGNSRFDQYCVFPNRVALVQTQVNRLTEVAIERPTRQVYVCTIVGANIDEQRAKMYFTKKYSNAIINSNLYLPVKIRVFLKRKENPIARVRFMCGKGRGKGVQITSNWKKVVKRSKMKEGEVFMFWFRGSSTEPGLKMIIEKLI